MDVQNKITALLAKDRYTFDDLVDVVVVLRSEQGCPWDREQDHKSIRNDFIEETYEAGIELFGTEVKSLRAGGCNLKDSYCEIDKGEMFALGVHISPYEQGNIFNKDPLRVRKLLRVQNQNRPNNRNLCYRYNHHPLR